MTNEEKTITGYPSIDKPWLKYYSEEAINAPLPEKTLYQYIYDNNKDYTSNTALNYFGRKISYAGLFDNIEKAAKAFSAIGIKAGDIDNCYIPKEKLEYWDLMRDLRNMKVREANSFLFADKVKFLN